MFGIGVQELLIILVVALLVLGPTRLPAAAKALAKGLQEMRRASDDLRQAFLFDEVEPLPRARRAPLVEVPPRSPESPHLEHSLAAAMPHKADEDELPLRPVPVDDLVARGEEGGDPTKRARDPTPRPASSTAETMSSDDVVSPKGSISGMTSTKDEQVPEADVALVAEKEPTT
ncbi:MAG: twin-arginine translocase TatA/TatE family subunit [Myxococcota bacterium]